MGFKTKTFYVLLEKNSVFAGNSESYHGSWNELTRVLRSGSGVYIHHLCAKVFVVSN